MVCDGCKSEHTQLMPYKRRHLCKSCFHKAYEQDRQAKQGAQKEDTDPQVGS